MDEVGRQKGEEFCSLGASPVLDLEGTFSSSSSPSPTGTSFRLQQLVIELVCQREKVVPQREEVAFVALSGYHTA